MTIRHITINGYGLSKDFARMRIAERLEALKIRPRHIIHVVETSEPVTLGYRVTVEIDYKTRKCAPINPAII